MEGSYARSAVWVVASRIAVQVGGILLLVVAGRALGPAALGVFVLIAGVAELLQRLATTGWREYIISHADDPEAEGRALWCVFMASCLGCAAGLLCAFALDLVTGEASYGLVLALLSLNLVLSAPTVVLEASLVRDGRVALVSKVLIMAQALSLAAAVAGVLLGLGILALAVGKVAFCFASGVGLLLFCRLPCLGFPGLTKLGEAVSFARHITASRTLAFFSAYGAEYFIGAFLGAAEVGFFRTGGRMAGAANELVSEASRQLTWSGFGSLRKTRAAGVRGPSEQEMSHVTHQFGFFLVAAVPLFSGLALCAGDLVALVFGEAWMPTALVVSALAMARLFDAPLLFTEPVFCMTGRPNILPKLQVFAILVALTGLAIFARYGIAWAALSQTFSSLLVGGVAFGLIARQGVLDLGLLGRFYALPAVLSGGAMVIGVLGCGEAAAAFPAGAASAIALKLAVEVVAGALIYGLVLHLLQPAILNALFADMFRIRRSSQELA